MSPVSCGHDLPAVTRTYNSGNGQKSTYFLCDVCKIKECFTAYVIKETSFDKLQKFELKEKLY